MKQLMYHNSAIGVNNTDGCSVNYFRLRQMTGDYIAKLLALLNKQPFKRKRIQVPGKNTGDFIQLSPDRHTLQKPPGDKLAQSLTESMFQFEIICIEKKIIDIVISNESVLSNNANTFFVSDNSIHMIKANKKALCLVLKNLVLFINDRNYRQQIKFEIIDDIDYTLIKAEHCGLPLSLVELKKLYLASPPLINDIGNALLFSCLHIIRLIGGWLTTGINQSGSNYLTLAVPKI